MKRRHALWCLLALALIYVPFPAQEPARNPNYPAHWFAPVIDPKKPVLEILPQEAGPGEVILSKRNELGLLSNFAPTCLVQRAWFNCSWFNSTRAAIRDKSRSSLTDH